jgi:hypothetical protein
MTDLLSGLKYWKTFGIEESKICCTIKERNGIAGSVYSENVEIERNVKGGRN